MGERSVKISMVTLGMFIIDDIEFLGSRVHQESVIGGAGTYAAVGARLVSGAEHSGSVGWIVDMGSDFPTAFRQVIESWCTSCIFREDRSRLTTRAWNGYGAGLGEHRAFKYLTPKVRLDHDSLSEQLLNAQAFHFVCSAERCMDLIQGILNRRSVDEKQKQSKRSRPLFIWEPIPDQCTPEHIDSFRQAVEQVDVVSPNSEELAGFFVGQSMSQAHMVAEIVEWGIGLGGTGSLVIREGKNGCSAFSSGRQIHLTAYHTPVEESQSKVVDPTGGGNAFLGALAMALSGDVSPHMAEAHRMLGFDDDLTLKHFFYLTIPLVYATVAASFVIEQPGVPTYRVQGNGSETWNGEGFGSRLNAYIDREKAWLTRQIRR